MLNNICCHICILCNLLKCLGELFSNGNRSGSNKVGIAELSTAVRDAHLEDCFDCRLYRSPLSVNGAEKWVIDRQLRLPCKHIVIG